MGHSFRLNLDGSSLAPVGLEMGSGMVFAENLVCMGFYAGGVFRHVFSLSCSCLRAPFGGPYSGAGRPTDFILAS